jgi:hypothetical protein
MDSEETLLQQLKVAPGSIEFNDVISTIKKTTITTLQNSPMA